MSDAEKNIMQKLIKNIKRRIPKINLLGVNIKIDNKGNYKSKIEARYHHQKIIAIKTASTFSKSLGESGRAFLKQLTRIKNKRIHIYN